MTGHPGQVVVASAAEAHCPRKCCSRGLGQVAQEAQARLFGGVLVVKRLDSIRASFHFGTQPAGFLTEGVCAVAAVYLDIQQRQSLPAGRDADRVRIHGCRQVTDHDGLQPLLQAHHAAALHARAVPEDGHRRDRCLEASALRHTASSSRARACTASELGAGL
jgi:hypothetical protein